MPRYLVNLPYTERTIEAENADEACDVFRNDETIFYEVEAEVIPEETANDAAEVKA